MTEKCFDIGTIQAFLDGELASDKLEMVSRHVSACDDCAIMLAEAEEESAVAFSVLEREFNTFVPTNRLRTKINDAIEKQKIPFRQTIFGFILNPSVAAFASLLIVVGLFAAMLSVKTDDNQNVVAEIIPDKPVVTALINKGSSPVQQIEANELNINNERTVKIVLSNNDKNKIGIVKATFSEKENIRQPAKTQKTNTTIDRNPPTVDARMTNENILGEESYIKTIATLQKTVDSRSGAGDCRSRVYRIRFICKR